MSQKCHQQTISLKPIVLELITRAQLLSKGDDLDQFVDHFLPRLQQACVSGEDLITELEVAEEFPFLNVRKLRNMRFRKQGPEYLKMGDHRNSRVYYKRSAIRSWIAELGDEHARSRVLKEVSL